MVTATEIGTAFMGAGFLLGFAHIVKWAFPKVIQLTNYIQQNYKHLLTKK